MLVQPAMPDAAQAIWERIGLTGRRRRPAPPGRRRPGVSTPAASPSPRATPSSPASRSDASTVADRGASRSRRCWFDSHCHVTTSGSPTARTAAVAARRASRRGVADDDHGRVRPRDVAGGDRGRRRDSTTSTPRSACTRTTPSNGVDSIVDLLDTPGIVAVGEAGLDYYYDHSPRDVQQRRVRRPDPARPRAPPPARHPHPRRLGRHVRHPRAPRAPPSARSSTASPAVPTRRGGASISAPRCQFSGIVTFKGAPEVQDAARECPLDRMLVETDSPYLAPVPHRASRTVRHGCPTSAGSSPTSGASTPTTIAEATSTQRGGAVRPLTAARAPGHHGHAEREIRWSTLICAAQDPLSDRRPNRANSVAPNDSDRRRFLLASAMTLLALPALWWANKQSDAGAPNVATVGIEVADADDSGANADAAAVIAPVDATGAIPTTTIPVVSTTPTPTDHPAGDRAAAGVPRRAERQRRGRRAADRHPGVTDGRHDHDEGHVPEHDQPRRHLPRRRHRHRHARSP